MKNNFKSMMSAVLAIGLLAAGCAETSNGPDGPDKKGGAVTRMVLTVQTTVPQGAGTRAAEFDTEDADAQESAIIASAGLKVAIFNDLGIFEQAKTITSLEALSGADEGKYQTPDSQHIELTEGSYYFFVIANDTEGKITLPTGGTMDEWMAGTLNVAFSGAPATLDIATYEAASKGFLIGTLWKAEVGTTVPAGGTAEDPVVVEVPALGRFAAKIWVSNLTTEAASPKNPALAGSFTEAKFALGSVALRMTNAGVVTTDGEVDPFEAGTIVESAVHNEAATSALFSNAANFTYTDVAIGAKNDDNKIYAQYASENTTARLDITSGPQDAQFYGNTTYVMLRTKYVPKQNEVYTVDGESVGALVGGDADYTGGTFYTAVINGQRLIFSTSPAGIDTDPVTDGLQAPTEMKEYAGGLNYHYFPVQDPSETDVVTRNRVLRNHYYEYEITQINDLGQHTDTVPDEEPVEELTDIVLKVSVRNWDKVTQAGIKL